jgi:hypothetical protein
VLIQILGDYEYFEFNFNKLQNLPARVHLSPRVLPVRLTVSELECSKKQNRIKSGVLKESQ